MTDHKWSEARRYQKNLNAELNVRLFIEAVAIGKVKNFKFLYAHPLGNAIVTIRRAPSPKKKRPFVIVDENWRKQ